MNQGDGDDRDSEDSEDNESPYAVIPVDPDACLLPDDTLCTFTVVDDMLVTLAQGPAQWKLQLFECPCPGEDARPAGQIGEVELSTCSPLAGALGELTAPHFLPVLCCVSPPGSHALHSCSRGSRGFFLEHALFGLLFGVDASLLESPVIVCGLPDGQLCCVVLKTLVTSRLSPGDPKALVKILHHLEEPIVFIGALKTESLPEDMEDTHPDCLVALGHGGRILAIKASWDEAGTLVPELRGYRLPGPVLCAACGGGGRVYHSTPSELCVVDLAPGGGPRKPVQPSVAPGGLLSLLCPAGLGICSVVALSVASEGPEGTSCCLNLRRHSLWVGGGMWNFPCGSLLRSELAHPRLPALFSSCVTLTGRLLPSCHRLALGACLGARGCLVVCVLCGRGGSCPWVARGKGISPRQMLCGVESREVQMGFHQALACFRRLGGGASLPAAGRSALELALNESAPDSAGEVVAVFARRSFSRQRPTEQYLLRRKRFEGTRPMSVPQGQTAACTAAPGPPMLCASSLRLPHLGPGLRASGALGVGDKQIVAGDGAQGRGRGRNDARETAAPGKAPASAERE